MKIISLFFLLLPVYLFAQQQHSQAVYNVYLQPDTSFNFSSKSIRFKEVVSDSRCPKGVTCIWAGEAKVLMQLFKKDSLIEEKVITIDSKNVPIEFSNGEKLVFLDLLELRPYPSIENKIPDEHYKLQMKVIERL